MLNAIFAGANEMRITTEQLNQVAVLLKTNDKDLVISACIKTLVDAGADVRQAIDATLGAGQFEQLVGEVFEAHKA
jgi:hypothetical protein